MPATTEVAPPTRGVVRDARSARPVSGATVIAERVGFHATTHTALDGSFHIPQLRQWHYLVYIGSPGTVPSPWWCSHSIDSPYRVAVQAPGFAPQFRLFTPPHVVPNTPLRNIIPPSIDFDLRANSK